LKNALTIEPGWLAKDKAAKLLGVSIRQLENRAAKGEIRKNTLPRQLNERAARVLYSIEDIDAIRAGRPNRYGEPAAPKPSLAVVGSSPGEPPAGFVAQLAQLMRALPPPAEKPKLKRWLTVREAAEYSGLPARWLAEAARAGKMRAQNVGVKRERWMFPREGLR
jgi:hypothetical protein